MTLLVGVCSGKLPLGSPSAQGILFMVLAPFETGPRSRKPVDCAGNTTRRPQPFVTSNVPHPHLFHNPPPLCYTTCMTSGLLATTEERGLTDPDEDLILSPRQSAFLLAFTESLTIKEACEKAGIHYNTWYKWRTKNSNFQQALARVSSIPIEQARVNMDRMAIKASERLEEALDAKEMTQCPYCKQDLVCHNCEVPVVISNFQASLKAVEFLLKRQGDLMNRTHVTGDVKHTKEMTHEQRRGASMWAMGIPIPPTLEAELKSLGYISDKGRMSEEEGVGEGRQVDGEIVEGEVVKTPPSKKTRKRGS